MLQGTSLEELQLESQRVVSVLQRHRSSSDDGFVQEERMAKCLLQEIQQNTGHNDATTDEETKESLQEKCKKLCPHQANVRLKRLRMKELLVTVPRRGFREIFYSSAKSDSEDEDEDSSTENQKTELKYEDWRIETVKAYPSSEGARTGATPCNTSFYMEIPASCDWMFVVDDLRDDLHSILEVLCGRTTTTTIMDAYITLRLEKYYRDFEVSPLPRKVVKRKIPPVREYSLRNPSAPTMERSVKPKLPALDRKQENFQYLSIYCLPVKDRDDDVAAFEADLTYIPGESILQDMSNPCKLIAPLYAAKHLYLSVFDFGERVVTAYDSSWHYLPMELRHGQIFAILKALTNNKCTVDDPDSPTHWQINFVKTSCPQYDEYSCGIYTVHYVDIVLRGIAHDKSHWKLSKKRVMQIRRHIVKELLETSPNGRKFLQAISE